MAKITISESGIVYKNGRNVGFCDTMNPVEFLELYDDLKFAKNEDFRRAVTYLDNEMFDYLKKGGKMEDEKFKVLINKHQKIMGFLSQQNNRQKLFQDLERSSKVF